MKIKEKYTEIGIFEYVKLPLWRRALKWLF